MKHIVVTGGCGFIGSHLISYLLDERKEYQVSNVDVLTYAGNVNNLAGHWNERALSEAFKHQDVDYVVNLAAESAVDRSIEDPAAFLKTNIFGTFNLVKLCREHGVERFIQVSTDEVYGSLGEGDAAFTEDSRLAPNNPYAASKASADLVVRSFVHTHDLPAIITRCSNNYGPRQFPEKLIPVIIINALKDRAIPVYGDGRNIRDWIHVKDHCAGIVAALERGKNGETYNFGGGTEITNIRLVKKILRLLDKPESLVSFVKDRAGHDFRYAMNHAKATRELGWEPRCRFDGGLTDTVRWYVESTAWIDEIQSGRYKAINDAFMRLHG
jgi:dTDP-glucose 4,6-dehydratase